MNGLSSFLLSCQARLFFNSLFLLRNMASWEASRGIFSCWRLPKVPPCLEAPISPWSCATSLDLAPWPESSPCCLWFLAASAAEYLTNDPSVTETFLSSPSSSKFFSDQLTLFLPGESASLPDEKNYSELNGFRSSRVNFLSVSNEWETALHIAIVWSSTNLNSLFFTVFIFLRWRAASRNP